MKEERTRKRARPEMAGGNKAGKEEPYAPHEFRDILLLHRGHLVHAGALRLRTPDWAANCGRSQVNSNRAGKEGLQARTDTHDTTTIRQQPKVVYVTISRGGEGRRKDRQLSSPRP
jgi:hypothetical protein